MGKVKVITSRDNSLIKLVCSLQTNAKTRKEEGLFVLEGLRICKDAFENSIKFDKLIISDTAFEKYEKDVKNFINISDEVYKIPDSLFSKISDTNSPQGILAVVKMPKCDFKIKENGKYIALENINDPSNFGAICRTSEALSVDGIILSSNGCDPYSPKSIRASMGTFLRMPIIVLDDFVGGLKATKLKLYACVVDKDAKPITKVSFDSGLALLIGNEANGLTKDAIAAADEKITIPMNGRVESLNAATAAAISMWEMMK